MKELFKTISCPVYVIICMLCFSCSDSSDDILNPDSSDDKVVEEVLNKASISWNRSVEHIKKQMKGYTLVDSDVDFLKFTLAARLPPPPHCVSTGLRLKIALMNRLF